PINQMIPLAIRGILGLSDRSIFSQLPLQTKGFQVVISNPQGAFWARRHRQIGAGSKNEWTCPA
ncbi:MAG: hypothetical protein ACREDP_17180, partial [Bradyrhizobium sp.]